VFLYRVLYPYTTTTIGRVHQDRPRQWAAHANRCAFAPSMKITLPVMRPDNQTSIVTGAGLPAAGMMTGERLRRHNHITKETTGVVIARAIIHHLTLPINNNTQHCTTPIATSTPTVCRHASGNPQHQVTTCRPGCETPSIPQLVYVVLYLFGK